MMDSEERGEEQYLEQTPAGEDPVVDTVVAPATEPAAEPAAEERPTIIKVERRKRRWKLWLLWGVVRSGRL